VTDVRWREFITLLGGAAATWPLDPEVDQRFLRCREKSSDMLASASSDAPGFPAGPQS
jgi:hypothetical protein